MSKIAIAVGLVVPLAEFGTGKVMAALESQFGEVKILDAQLAPDDVPARPVPARQNMDRLPRPARRGGTKGYAKPEPGQRVMDYAIKAGQHNQQPMDLNAWTAAVRKAGYVPPKPTKLRGTLATCLSSLCALGLVNRVDKGIYVISPKGIKCPIPVPYSFNGNPLPG